MADISVLGNAAAVPIIIAITQFLKKNFDFTRNGDVFSLLISIVVCWSWEFYYTPEDQLTLLWGLTLVAKGKHAISLLVVSFATWLSASKTYDLFIGDKKRVAALNEAHGKREELEKQLAEIRDLLPDGGDGDGSGSDSTDTTSPEAPPAPPASNPTDDKLRDILEEGK